MTASRDFDVVTDEAEGIVPGPLYSPYEEDCVAVCDAQGNILYYQRKWEFGASQEASDTVCPEA